MLVTLSELRAAAKVVSPHHLTSGRTGAEIYHYYSPTIVRKIKKVFHNCAPNRVVVVLNFIIIDNFTAMGIMIKLNK